MPRQKLGNLTYLLTCLFVILTCGKIYFPATLVPCVVKSKMVPLSLAKYGTHFIILLQICLVKSVANSGDLYKTTKQALLVAVDV
jgi:hypothetical protein